MNLISGSVLRVTSRKNRGDAARLLNNGSVWSPDGSSIGFTAYVSGRVPRSATCNNVGNSDVFITKADGSTVATHITDTNGTSAEASPRWGW